MKVVQIVWKVSGSVDSRLMPYTRWSGGQFYSVHVPWQLLRGGGLEGKGHRKRPNKIHFHLP